VHRSGSKLILLSYRNVSNHYPPFLRTAEERLTRIEWTSDPWSGRIQCGARITAASCCVCGGERRDVPLRCVWSMRECGGVCHLCTWSSPRRAVEEEKEEENGHGRRTSATSSRTVHSRTFTVACGRPSERVAIEMAKPSGAPRDSLRVSCSADLLMLDSNDHSGTRGSVAEIAVFSTNHGRLLNYFCFHFMNRKATFSTNQRSTRWSIFCIFN
jgi:hypothetical protein